MRLVAAAVDPLVESQNPVIVFVVIIHELHPRIDRSKSHHQTTFVSAGKTSHTCISGVKKRIASSESDEATSDLPAT